MTSTTTTATATATIAYQHLPLHKSRTGAGGGRADRGRAGYSIRKYPQHLLAYSIISILVFLCWLPDFIVALKDVSVTIPQAVKRGSNAMLTCNYDMENDTLYSVKWYKGRREFYRYTPKENPAMKVFLTQSGLNVERNLSNQSHVVLLAVPLNISGKFTCEISVEAPSFQTAMVSGEMEVVELPEEQASVTGIQPRYRIGDLVDGNCSIKYSKPAANLTWTINGIVVPPHHIKTYQIEKYEETNLESVMSAVHFMVTTQHFIKAQMRLKCTASIFDIFKEEIESIIEEDRPRIMASGQSYPPDHGYGTHGESDGYEHNESYLTYFSAPKSSASRTAEFFIAKIFKFLQRDLLQKFQLSLSSNDITAKHIENTLTMTFINNLKWNLMKITQIILTMTTYCCKQLQLQLMLIKFIITVMVILLAMTMIAMQWQQRKKFHRKYHQMMMKMTTTKDERKNEKMKCNCIEKQMKQQQLKKKNLAMNLLYEKLYKVKRWQQQEQQQQQHQENENCYLDANNDDCQGECEQQQQQQEQLQHQHHSEQCLVANQNVVNEKVFLKDTTITSRTISKNTNETSTTSSTDVATTTTTADSLLDCQQHVSQTLAFTSISSFSAMPSLSSILSSSSSSSSTTLGYRKTYAPDSFPLYALDASKSNNAKYMSKDQTLLMTSTTSTTPTAATIADDNTTDAADVVVTSTHLTYTLASVITPSPSSLPPSSSASSPSASVETLGAPSELLQTSATVSVSPFFRNNNLMAFIGELLLHQC